MVASVSTTTTGSVTTAASLPRMRNLPRNTRPPPLRGDLVGVGPAPVLRRATPGGDEFAARRRRHRGRRDRFGTRGRALWQRATLGVPVNRVRRGRARRPRTAPDPD